MQNPSNNLIPAHGGYRNLKSYQTTEIIYDLTAEFCKLHLDRSYMTYKSYLKNPESAANAVVCLIHQANFLLDRQLSVLGQEFLEKGGFTEKLYNSRIEHRSYGSNRTYEKDNPQCNSS